VGIDAHAMAGRAARGRSGKQRRVLQMQPA
jgi:hypothetical protein